MASSTTDAYVSPFNGPGGSSVTDGPFERARPEHGLPSLLRRPAAAGGLGLLGGALVGFGVILPWVSTFAGLVTLSGVGVPTGRTLLALGALVAVAALVSVTARGAHARWAVGVLGFLAVLWSGYLLINLLAEVRGADSMTLPAVGPGLPVSLAGGVLALSVLFLPERSAAPRSHGSTAARTTGVQPRAVAELTWLRLTTIVLAVVAALAHVPVTPDHLREAPYIGVGFLLLTAALLLLSTGLMISSARWLWPTLAVVCLTAVVAYVVSRSVGLPLMEDDIGNWSEPLGIVSIVAETLAALTALVALRRPRPQPEGG